MQQHRCRKTVRQIAQEPPSGRIIALGSPGRGDHDDNRALGHGDGGSKELPNGEQAKRLLPNDRSPCKLADEPQPQPGATVLPTAAINATAHESPVSKQGVSGGLGTGLGNPHLGRD